MADPHRTTPSGKPRARSLAIQFAGSPGRWDAVTDVPGVEVGYTTLVEGDSVRTGVTALHPRGADHPGDPVAAGFFSQNGNGEMTGVSWIEESGTFTGPVAITNTHAVGVAHAGIVAWTVKHHPHLADAWLLPVAAETWDGYLNDINGHHVSEASTVDALEAAASGRVEEGSVGGGTGMSCYQLKGGSGTASRLVGYGDTTYTVGAFAQANFGPATSSPSRESRSGSCWPTTTRWRLARTGTTGSHFSGDLFLAFSVANQGGLSPSFATLRGDGAGSYDHLDLIPWGFLDPFYEAVVQGVEEAVANALVANEDMVGYRGHRTPALPRDRVAAVFESTR